MCAVHLLRSSFEVFGKRENLILIFFNLQPGRTWLIKQRSLKETNLFKTIIIKSSTGNLKKISIKEVEIINMVFAMDCSFSKIQSGLSTI